MVRSIVSLALLRRFALGAGGILGQRINRRHKHTHHREDVMNNRDDLGNIHSITPKHLCTEVKSQAPSYSFMPWSRCQPHGFILSWRNIPVNRVGRFYSMFVWIWRGMGAFLREPLALLCFPRGVRWGLK